LCHAGETSASVTPCADDITRIQKNSKFIGVFSPACQRLQEKDHTLSSSLVISVPTSVCKEQKENYCCSCNKKHRTGDDKSKALPTSSGIGHHHSVIY
jgi:hypothetical protein